MRPRSEILDSLMHELTCGPDPVFVEKPRFASIDILPSVNGAGRPNSGMLFRLNQRAIADRMNYLQTALTRLETRATT